MLQIATLKTKVEALIKRPNIRAVLVITFFTLVSRALGLLRQILVYNRMDKISSDLLIASDKIPSNIAQLLITGAIISSVLPVASRIETDTKDDTQVSKYLNLMLLSLLALIFCTNVFAIIFAPQILSLPFVTSANVLDSFKDAGKLNDYFTVTRILLLGTALFAMQAILNVVLFLKKKFDVFAWAGTIYNLAYIFGILLTPRNGYITTAWGAVLGISLTTLIYLVEARRLGYRGFAILADRGKNFIQGIRLNYDLYRADINRTWQVFLPRIFILDSVISANLLITPIAQSSGQITAVDIALAIQGSVYIIITSLSTVVFPDLAKLMNESKDRFWKSLISHTKNAVFLSIGVTVLTILCAPIIMWIFDRFGKGQGNEPYIILVAQVASVGIIFRAFREIMGKYFYVKEKLWEPALLSILGVGAQILSTYILFLMNFDSGLNVAVTLTINNIAWAIVASYLIWKDWKQHQRDAVKVAIVTL
jgi:peptidoglycan biosynthesis protein MviN/MurJ (putative lipid II flippase)